MKKKNLFIIHVENRVYNMIGFAVFAKEKKNQFFSCLFSAWNDSLIRNTNRSLLSNHSLAWCASTHASLPQCSIDFPSILLSITARTKPVAAPAKSQYKHLFLWKEESFKENVDKKSISQIWRLESRSRRTPRGDYVHAICVRERRSFRSMMKQCSWSRDKCHFSNKIKEEDTDRSDGKEKERKWQDRLLKHFFDSILSNMITCGWTICRFEKTMSKLRMKAEDRRQKTWETCCTPHATSGMSFLILQSSVGSFVINFICIINILTSVHVPCVRQRWTPFRVRVIFSLLDFAKWSRRSYLSFSRAWKMHQPRYYTDSERGWFIVQYFTLDILCCA